jgi:hypothetical protein
MCPPLWSSGQSFWLQIQRPGFDSWHYQIFWEVVCLERGPLSLMSTTEELLKRKCSGSSLENREYGRREQSRWPCGYLSPQTLTLTLLISGGRSAGIVRLRTQATEVFYMMIFSNEWSSQTTWFIRNKGPEESKCRNSTLSTTPQLLPYYLHIIRNHADIPLHVEPRQMRK